MNSMKATAWCALENDDVLEEDFILMSEASPSTVGNHALKRAFGKLVNSIYGAEASKPYLFGFELKWPSSPSGLKSATAEWVLDKMPTPDEVGRIAYRLVTFMELGQVIDDGWE